MPHSDGFKINVNRLNATESLMILLEITHPFISEPIRLVNDSQDMLFLGNNYLAMPFNVVRQDDIQGELPKVNLVIPNVGRSLVKWVDSSGGGRGAKINVLLARRSSSVEEERIEFGINNVTVSTETVNFSLVIQNNLVKRSVRYIYDSHRAMGLF